MFKPSQTFIDRVTNQFFERPYEPLPDVGEVFRNWHENHPSELEEIAKEVDVKLEELFAGDTISAAKILMEKKNPLEMTHAFLTDPITRLRAKYAKVVSQETYKAFKDVNLEQFVRKILTLDTHWATFNLVEATRNTLQLYGFVEVEDYWEASTGRQHCINRTRFKHPDDFGKHIVLPYDHYSYVIRFARGLEEMKLTVHHRSAKDAQEGDYFTRTLIGNTKLLEDLPVLTVEQIQEKYSEDFRDPLTMAFNDGFIVQIDGNPPQFAYHSRILVEALTKRLDDKANLYFFYKACGLAMDALPRRDMKEQVRDAELELLRMQLGQAIPEFDKWLADAVEQVKFHLHDNKVPVDISMYLPIFRTENDRRLRGIKTLSNLCHLRVPYGTQSRLEHCLGVLHMGRVMANRVKLSDKERMKVEIYGGKHDSGHLTGSHPTEDYFKPTGFDHDKFAIDLLRQSKDSFKDIIDVEEIVEMFEHKNPLHNIIDGPFGSDRMYYLSIDPEEYGLPKDYDPTKLLTHLRWDGKQLFVDQYPEGAFEFLDYRAKMYEELYFTPSTQIADAYQKKMLFKAKITSPFQKVVLKNPDSINEHLQKGVETEFWRLTDLMFQHYLWHHENREVSEIMRHLIMVYHKSPHASVAVLKLKGYEQTEKQAEIPLYPWLKYCFISPNIEGIEAEKLAKYHKTWQNPQRQNELEHEIARRSGIPERHVIVASVPNMQKLASEYAPVRIGDEIKSLFDWRPEYKQSFLERASRMACLRVAVHPQLYPFAFDFFKNNSLAKIVEDVYGKD